MNRFLKKGIVFVTLSNSISGEAINQSYFLVLVPVGVIGNLLSFLVWITFLKGNMGNILCNYLVRMI